MTSGNAQVQLNGGVWSPTRPGVFFIIKANGNIDVWDLLEKYVCKCTMFSLFLCAHVHTDTCIRMCVNAQMHMYKHTYVHIRTYVRTYIQNTHSVHTLHMYVCIIQVHICTVWLYINASRSDQLVDLTFCRSHEPSHSQNISSHPLTAITPVAFSCEYTHAHT